MFINNVSNVSGFLVSTGNSLTEETRRKLLALGIDPTTVCSEAEALILIRKFENKIAVQQTTNESNSKNTCTAEQDLQEKERVEANIYNMLNMTANVNKYILGL